MFLQKVKSTQISVSDCTKSWMEPVKGGIAQYCVSALRGIYKAQMCFPQTVTKSRGTAGNAAVASHTQPSRY